MAYVDTLWMKEEIKKEAKELRKLKDELKKEEFEDDLKSNNIELQSSFEDVLKLLNQFVIDL